jgi:DNA primase catalytic subunit
MEKEVFRPSTLAEREEFYKSEFSISKVKLWFKKTGRNLPQICALDAGTETGIILDKKNKGKMLYFEFKDLKAKIMQYLPEDVYYDRNVYKNPEKLLNSLKFKNHISQELAFDIDIDNMNHKVSNESIKKAYTLALKMEKELKEKHGFKNMQIVYSGRGFHIHVFDKQASTLTINEREKIIKSFSKYPIDPWVSRGFIRLIRMPYSLNSLVSRKVIPIDNHKFNPEKSIPRFLSK